MLIFNSISLIYDFLMQFWSTTVYIEIDRMGVAVCGGGGGVRPPPSGQEMKYKY